MPATAPAYKTVGTCRVYYPGTYTVANKPDLDGTGEVYFKSGIYYFDNVGEIKVNDTVVTGGQPGDSGVASEEESLFNPDCKTAATGPMGLRIFQISTAFAAPSSIHATRATAKP